MATPNVGDDPINPKYYDGTACAEIIEHMPTNVGFAAKYAWRLGEKDSETQEAGKAIWYLERQLKLSWLGLGAPAWYHTYAADRILARCAAKKMGLRRSEIMGECVAYTIDGEDRHLERAIGLFEIYLGETDANHK